MFDEKWADLQIAINISLEWIEHFFFINQIFDAVIAYYWLYY